MKTFFYTIVLTVSITLVSCKNDKNVKNEVTNDSEKTSDISKTYLDNQLEEALYNGHFIKNEEGYDILLIDNLIYLLKDNPSQEARNTHFFLHVIPKNGSLMNFDFSPTEYLINENLSDNYANVLVYKRELPSVKGAYDINVGQFNDKARTWENYIQVDKMNEQDYKYKNEYVENTKNNRYLNAFESAFNEGYFMKHQLGFDLLLHDHMLYYIRANGTASDLKDMFFLHIKYDNKDAVYNYDFRGEPYQINKLLGEKYENFIVVQRNIPDIGKISEVDTGQFDKDRRSWSVLYRVSELYDNMDFIYNDQYSE
jgi:hypothetical protein